MRILVLRATHCSGEATEPSDEEGEDEVDEDDLPPPLAQGERNSQLAVGYKGDRSYVIRGSKIGVFSHASGPALKYHATLNKVINKKGKSFNPAHVRPEYIL